MTDPELVPGLHEALLTASLERRLPHPDDSVSSEIGDLANAEAADRLSRHIAAIVTRAINSADENHRAELGIRITRELVGFLSTIDPSAVIPDSDLPLDPGRVLDGQPRAACG